MEHIRSEYGARLIRWKNQSDQTYFSPYDAVKLFRKLRKGRFVPPQESDFLFVSPSANVPTHEMAMFEEDRKKREGKTRFVTGDLLAKELFNTGYPIWEEKLRVRARVERLIQEGFTFEEMNAYELPSEAQGADIIWDRKGALWHSVSPREYPKGQEEVCRQRVQDLLYGYKRALSPTGHLVIDSGALKCEISTIQSITKFQESTAFHQDIFESVGLRRVGEISTRKESVTLFTHQ